MKSLEELFIGWRDSSLTDDEFKDLKERLAEPQARTQLFEDFLTTAVIVETLKAEHSSKILNQDAASAEKISRRPFQFHFGPPQTIKWLAAAVLLLVACGAALFYAIRPGPTERQAANIIPQPNDSPKKEGQEPHPAVPAVKQQNEVQPKERYERLLGELIVDRQRGGPIKEGSLVECKSEQPAVIKLADDSILELAPASAAVLRERQVDLRSGKGTFQVTPGKGEFWVQTDVGTITVLGTKFSVELRPQSSGSEKGGGQMNKQAMALFVAVMAGSVGVNYNGSPTVVLTMGQRQLFGAESGGPATAHQEATPPQMLQQVTEEIQNLQQKLANPNISAAVKTAGGKLLADLNTLRNDLTNANPNKATIKADMEAVQADRKVLIAAEEANGGKTGHEGHGGQIGQHENPAQLLQQVTAEIQEVQQKLASPNLSAAAKAAAEKLLADLNTLKTDLSNGAPVKATIKADMEAVEADRKALIAAVEASGENTHSGHNVQSGQGVQSGHGSHSGQVGGNSGQRLEIVSHEIQKVQERLANSANLPANMTAALQKLLADLNTLKADLTQAAAGGNLTAKVEADEKAVQADREALGESGQGHRNAPR